jgi:hypothetical protein
MIMVREITFILLIVIFLGSHFIFERYLKLKNLKFTTRKILLYSLIIECIAIILAANIEIFFYIMIYITVIVASFITVFFRNKRKIGGQKI